MVKDIKVGKTYWYYDEFVENYTGKCTINKHVKASQNEPEYWNGDCLELMGSRGFLPQDLYETKEEVESFIEEKYSKELDNFKRSVDTPEKLLSTMMEAFIQQEIDYSILDTSDLKDHLEEQIKQFFNITF